MKWLNGFSLAGTFEGEFSNVSISYTGKGLLGMRGNSVRTGRCAGSTPHDDWLRRHLYVNLKLFRPFPPLIH